MARLNGLDASDNNGDPYPQSRFSGLDFAMLKLYPSSFSSWTRTAYANAKAAGLTTDAIGFYASDSTPTWATSKAAITYALNADGTTFTDHPFAFDLFEFGYSHAHIAAQIAAAKADGQLAVGQYAADGNFTTAGETWKWIADWTDEPHHHADYVIWQDHNYLNAHGDGLADHDVSVDGMSVADLIAAITTTGGGGTGGGGTGGSDLASGAGVGVVYPVQSLSNIPSSIAFTSIGGTFLNVADFGAANISLRGFTFEVQNAAPGDTEAAFHYESVGN